MGSWNATCCVSHLPIFAGDPVRLVMLSQTPPSAIHTGSAGGLTHPTDLWCPASFAIPGTYDDHGGVELATPSDWRAVLFLELLKAALVPVEQGENSHHDLPCRADLLTGLNVVQRLCRKRGGRVFVRGRQNGTGLEPLRIGYMMLHERVYQAMIESYPDLFDVVVTPESIIAQAGPLLDRIVRASTDRMSSYEDGFPAVPGLSEFLFDRTGSGVGRHGMSLSLADAGRVFMGALNDGAAAKGVAMQQMLREIAEFSVFHRNLESLRRHYGPMLSSGEDEDLALHRRICALTQDMLLQIESEYRCEDGDEDEVGR